MKVFLRRDRKDLRRKNRNDMPEAEKIMWNYLRNRRLNGWKFRRQHSIGPYIVDFFCPDAKLVIEIDGDSHFGPEAEQYDAVREAHIQKQSIRVVRFTNTEIFNNIDEVIASLVFKLGDPPRSQYDGNPL